LAAEKLVAKSGDEFLAGDEINAVTFIEGGGALKIYGHPHFCNTD